MRTILPSEYLSLIEEAIFCREPLQEPAAHPTEYQEIAW